MVEHNAYRSCVFPMNSNSQKIEFGAVIGFKMVFLLIENLVLVIAS